MRRFVPKLVILAVCLLLLYASRGPLLLWMSGFRYRPKVPVQAQVALDIEYTVHRGRSMKLDLYLPDTPGSHPLIVWLHSGAWKTLNKSCIEQGAMNQVGRGYALASVEYSLSQEQKWPAQMEQVRAAIRWLASNADTYEIDPAGPVVWGMSAGGHIAAVVGASADLEPGEGTWPIRGVVAWCAPNDLSRLAGGAYASAEQLLGYDPALDSQKDIPANPIPYISPGDPPFYILHGTEDTVVPVSHAIRLSEVLERAGVPVTLRVWDQYRHEDVRFNAEDCMTEVERFLDRLYPRMGAERGR